MRSLKYLILPFSLAAALFVPQVQAGATLQAISVNGTAQNSVATVRVGVGNAAAKAVTLTVGQPLESGTRLETPAGVRLQLLTSNNNVLQISPNSDIRIAITAKAEQTTVTRGGVFAYVRTKLDFFSLSTPGNRFQGVAEGTAYGVTVDNNGVNYARTEGNVRVTRQVPVQIANAAQKNDKNKRQPERSLAQTTQLTDAQSSAFFDPRDAQGLPAFDTYEQALGYFSAAYDAAVQSGDKMRAADVLSTAGVIQLEAGDAQGAVSTISNALALNYELQPGGLDPVFIDDHTNLGYALLGLGQPDEALLQFVEAMNIILEVDPMGPMLAESLLDQVQAYIDMKDAEATQEIVLSAIEILEMDIESANAVLEELIAESQGDPTELAVMVAWEIGSRLQSLGWAYQIAGQKQDAEDAYSGADEISQLLEETGFYVDY